jgi:hypothetical protein
MLYGCGTDSVIGFQKYTQNNNFIKLESGIETDYYVVARYITNTGKSIIICFDPHLDYIKCSGHCFMIAEGMISFKDCLEEKSVTDYDWFVKYLHYRYFEQKGKNVNSIFSLFELTPTYPDLCLVATGIDRYAEGVKLIDYKTVIEFGHGKIGIHLGSQGGMPSLVLTDKGTGKLGEYGSSEGYPRIATSEETYAVLRFANKEGVTVLIEELQKLSEQFDELSNEGKKITRPPIINCQRY